MVKNKLEKLFSESMHSDKELWAMKLISNPLTHQNTPADYIIDYLKETPIFPGEEGDVIKELRLILLECKMVTLDEEDKGRFAFKRLKQMHDLINFENMRPSHHRSYFCIAFWAGRWDKSEIYIIPVHTMERLVGLFSLKLNKVSINREEAKIHLNQFKAGLIGGLIDLDLIKQ